MDVKELNKSQLILLAILLSFITSIATGITTVTLLEKAPQSITVPINKVVRQTVDKIAPTKAANFEALSDDQKNLLEQLKAIKPLTVSLYLKGDSGKKIEDKILGTGLFLGNEKIVVASIVPVPKDGEVYIVKSVLGEQMVSKVSQEKDFTIIELTKTENPPVGGEPAVKDDTTPAPDTPQ